MNLIRTILLLSCGAIAALPSSMTLACTPSPVQLGTDGDLRQTVLCPGFQVSGGAVSGVQLSVTLTAVFTTPGSAHDFTDTDGSFNPVTFSSTVSGSGFQTITDTNFTSNRFLTPLTPQFGLLAAGVVNSGTVSSLDACYAVTYTYSGVGAPVGQQGSGTCAITDPGSAQTPEPSTAWLILPGLLGYGFTRRRRISRTTSGSRPSRASLPSGD